jgi:hypothetical protein
MKNTYETKNYSDGSAHIVPKFEIKDFIFFDERYGADNVPVQTVLVNKLLNKTNGYYVEIGAGHYFNKNNTFYLEKFLNWNGVAIDNNKNKSDLYNENRKNYCLNRNAITYEWDEYFKNNNFPNQIDYLQIDIDKIPKNANLLALINLPICKYRFSVITIEHNAEIDYEMESVRRTQREILSGLGYALILRGMSEDWWVDKNIFPDEMEYIGISSLSKDMPI